MSQISITRDEVPNGSATFALPSWQRWGDSFGLIASVGCAIHCAAIPVLFSLLPTWGLSWMADPIFHQAMFVICFTFAVIAFLPGLRKHGKLHPLTMGCCGLLLIGAAAFWGEQYCCETSATSATSADINSIDPTVSVADSVMEMSSEPIPATGDPNLQHPSEVSIVKMPCLCRVAKECGDTTVQCQHESKYIRVAVLTADAPLAVSNKKDLASMVNVQGSESQVSSWFVLLIKMLTPVGGIVLVMAHLFNQRLGCQTSACCHRSAC